MEGSGDLMDWRKFTSMYAKTHNITYAQALKDCAGPTGVWAKYKEAHNIKPKRPPPKNPRGPRVKPDLSSQEMKGPHGALVDPAPAESKPKPKPKAKPKAKRGTVSVAKPPKGKKMIVQYLTDSDEEPVKPHKCKSNDCCDEHEEKEDWESEEE